MKSRDFCFWLQGFFELNGTPNQMSAVQLDQIRKHLDLVFKHEIDPSMGPQAHQDVLNEIHAAPPYKPYKPTAMDGGTVLRC